MQTIRFEGACRIVTIYKGFQYQINEVYKIPKDQEAVFNNQDEACIWNKTENKYLLKCELVDDIFLKMDYVENDVSKNRHNIIVENLPTDFIRLIENHPKLEYGIDKNGIPKIYDYADYEGEIEDFIEELNTL